MDACDLIDHVFEKMHREREARIAKILRDAAESPLISGDTPEEVALRESYLTEATELEPPK